MGGWILLAQDGGWSRGRRRLAGFTWILVAVLYGVVVVGGVVTSSDSGLGCGQSWPTCAGGFLPPDTLHGVLEWLHRLVAGVASVLAVLLAVLVWRQAAVAARPGLLRRLAVSLLGILAIQVMLGGLVVLYGIPPWLIALHAGAALLLLDVALSTALVFTAQTASGAPSTRPGRSPRPVLWPLAAWAIVTSMLGSYLAHVARPCAGFATCLTTLARQGGTFGAGLWHWLAALVLAGGLILVLAGRHHLPARARRWLWRSLTAIGIQALLGILLVAFTAPVLLALHEAIGMAVGASLWAAATSASLLGAKTPAYSATPDR